MAHLKIQQPIIPRALWRKRFSQLPFGEAPKAKDHVHIVTFVIMRPGRGVTVNESQIEIPAERGQDFVWHVEQINKKTYLKSDVGENRENVE